MSRASPGRTRSSSTRRPPRPSLLRPRRRRRPGSACAALDEVPDGGLKQFTVDGTSVVVARAGNEVFACQALCAHEAIPLEEGVHDGATLTCLEHMWQFDLRTGAPMGDATCGVTTYRLKEERGEVYVDLG